MALDRELLQAVLWGDDLPGEARDFQVPGPEQLTLWPEQPRPHEPVQLALWSEQLRDTGPLVEHLDIDRAWHVLHFLLTGSARADDHALSFLAAGGRDLTEDLGNGPLRAFTPAQVQALSESLAPVTGEQLLAAFDSELLGEAGVYGWPEGWSGATVEQGGPFLLDAFHRTKVFVRRGAALGRALLVYAL